jgi:fluoroquinolone resistance protein
MTTRAEATFGDGQQYEGLTFTRIAASAVRLHDVEFVGCTFDRCTLQGAVLSHCTFRECRFDTCDLSGAALPNVRLNEVRFVGSKLTGIDWTQAGDSELSRRLLRADFEGCVLTLGSFFGLTLHGRTLVRSTARETDFRDADLTEACLQGTDLAGALFHGTKLLRADLTGATDYAIDPRTCAVRGARFSLPEAVSLLRGFEIVLADP